MAPPRFGPQLDLAFTSLAVTPGGIPPTDRTTAAVRARLQHSAEATEEYIWQAAASNDVAERAVAIGLLTSPAPYGHPVFSRNGVSVVSRIIVQAWAQAVSLDALWTAELDKLASPPGGAALWTADIQGLPEHIPSLGDVIQEISERSSRASSEEVAAALGWIRHRDIRRNMALRVGNITDRVIDAALLAEESGALLIARAQVGQAETHHVVRVLAEKPTNHPTGHILATLTAKGIEFPSDIVSAVGSSPKDRTLLDLANPSTPPKHLVAAIKKSPDSIPLALIALSRPDWNKSLAVATLGMCRGMSGRAGWDILKESTGLPLLSAERFVWIIGHLDWDSFEEAPFPAVFQDLVGHAAWGPRVILALLDTPFGLNGRTNDILWHESVRHLPKVRAHMEHYGDGATLGAVLLGSNKPSFLANWPRLAQSRPEIALDVLHQWTDGGRTVPETLITPFLAAYGDVRTRARLALLHNRIEAPTVPGPTPTSLANARSH